jgi:hypothetical protein
MRAISGGALTAVIGVCMATGTASAQSAASCSYDPATATVAVAVNGVETKLFAAPSRRISPVASSATSVPRTWSSRTWRRCPAHR